MARPLRIEYPGAWYHVMNRGAAHQKIFHNSEHFQLFVDLLADCHERYQIEIHAYCLMNNHYHLCIRTPYPNLGRALRHINGVFTQKYNRLHRKDGALFRGRYKAILVDADEYLLQLSRYIHLNPVSAGIVSNPEQYIWSSYKFYIKPQDKPSWLFSDETLNYFGNCHQSDKYKTFVLEGIDEPTKKFYEKLKISPILGSDKFIEKVRVQNDLFEDKEIPDFSRLKKNCLPAISEIINVVAKYFDVSSSCIIKNNLPRKIENLPRKISIYLASHMTGEKLKSIATEFNHINYSTVSKIYRRIEDELKINVPLFSHIEKIKQILSIKGVKS